MTVTHNSNEDIIGRAFIDDVDAILSVPLVDPNEVEHVLQNNCDSVFTWDYSNSRPALHKLYEKAKTGQWNGTTDLPWETDVDVEKVVAADQALIGAGLDPARYIGTPLEKWNDKEWLTFGVESRQRKPWTVSRSPTLAFHISCGCNPAPRPRAR